MQSKIIRCALYDRVSTDIQVKEGLSLDAQRQALTDYALSRGYKIVDYYSDEGTTARKKMQNRRDLMRLLNDVKADRIDLILVTKLDRWFRNIKDYHNTQAILEAHNCNWKTIFEEYDTTTSNGRFAINIMLSVNENECDRDSERIKTVFEYKKRNREHLTGKPAYGYCGGSDKKMIKDEKTRHIVEDIFNHYFKVYSKKETVRYIVNKYAENAPSTCQVNRILTNEVYSGSLYGIEDYCEPYISKEQYKKIREISDSKIIPHQIEPFYFSSLIVCPICGRKMNGFVKRQKLKYGGVSEYKRYRCGAKFTDFHNGACLSESVIEKYLFDNIVDELHKEMVNVKTRQLTSAPKSSAVSIRKEMDRLNNMYQKGRISDSFYDEQYSILEARLRTELESDIETVTIKAFEPIANTLDRGWEEVYSGLDAAHKKAFWKGILKEIHVDPATRKVCGFKFLS